jgi:prevent-host-death family protein
VSATSRAAAGHATGASFFNVRGKTHIATFLATTNAALTDIVIIVILIITVARAKMKRTVSAMEARKRLGELLEGVFYRNDEVVIERAGKPMAVVIPAYLYQNIERGRDRLMELIKMNWEHNKDVPPEELEADIEAVMLELRPHYKSAAPHNTD